jgi:hypothetical protein
VGKYGEEEGCRKLKRWEDEEADLKRKVVNIKTHREIARSPYDLPKPICERQGGFSEIV